MLSTSIGPGSCFVLAYKSDNAPDDGSVASAMTSCVFQIHADAEAAMLRTTSVEPLGSENSGRSLFAFLRDVS